MKLELDDNIIVLKRYVEQLKFEQMADNDNYKIWTPACISFHITPNDVMTDEIYNIFRNENGKYIIINNSIGGCSMSRRQGPENDIDDLFEILEEVAPLVVRDTLQYHQRGFLKEWWMV